MSLIHKALKKAEGKESIADAGSVDLPEEELVATEGKNKFSSTEITPRTIGLMVLTLFAGIFAVYMNFCADKNPGKMAVALPPPVQAPVAAPVPIAPAIKTDGQEELVEITKRKDDGATAVKLSPEAKFVLDEGDALFVQGEFSLALAKFEEALTKAPNSAEVLNSIGLTQKKLGNSTEAERYYNQAIKNSPDCSECFNNLGVLYMDTGDGVAAVMNLKKAVTISETYADPYFNLAVIMEKEGNLKSAVDNYKKFLTYTTTDNENLKERVRSRIEDIALNWQN